MIRHSPAFVPQPGAPAAADDLDTAVQVAIDNALAAETRRAYRADWDDFTAWCQHQHRSPIPADHRTISGYITDLSRHGAKPSTIGRRLAAIRFAHLSARLPNPTDNPEVAATRRGLNRLVGVQPSKKMAITTSQLKAMVDQLDSTTIAGLRDRALLLVGFAGAFRRSEIVALNVSDFEVRPKGILVNLRRSKTDQEGAGRKVAIVYGDRATTCPVRCLQAWLAAAAITDGPVFRPVTRYGTVRTCRLSSQSVALIVKRNAGPVGLPTDFVAGHSLRSGHVTTADSNGATLSEIQTQTAHKRVETLLGYIRPAELLEMTSSRLLGL